MVRDQFSIHFIDKFIHYYNNQDNILALGLFPPNINLTSQNIKSHY